MALRQCMRVGPEERVYLLAAVVPQLRLKRSLRRLSGGDDGRREANHSLVGLHCSGRGRHKRLCGNLAAYGSDLFCLQLSLLMPCQPNGLVLRAIEWPYASVCA